MPRAPLRCLLLLCALCVASAPAPPPPVQKIGLMKARACHSSPRPCFCRVCRLTLLTQTHKTGSTTLGAVLYRYGARHGKRFYCQGAGTSPCGAAHIVRPCAPLPPGQEFDLQLHHISGNGPLGRSFGCVVAWYRLMLSPNKHSRRGGRPPWALVTSVREPVSHYLSWYHYYAEPDLGLSVEEWAATGRSPNGLADEFGLRDERSTARFAESIAWGCAGKGVCMNFQIHLFPF